MDDVKAKQQIVEKINAATNILVTVSNDPSVDSLSAALGLTVLLDRIEKHSTAVFSGAVPPAIEFLEPEKTFDDSTDSLRDFIIALDKSKADHIRYKVEGDAVRIYIAPYKTTISADDLEFSQGDFNVELVIALGVDSQDHLDGALESHGQVLHDATIITVTAGEMTSKLGGIDWHDAQASSLSEMVAGLAEALKSDKTKSLLDAQIATALLTGIVAETDRFSNTHTTSRVMTIAAQLMAAGADQQLIASKLQEGADAPTPAPRKKNDEEDNSTSKDSLDIDHEGETLAELDKRVRGKETDEEPAQLPEERSSEESVPAPEDIKVTSAYALDGDDAASVEPSLGGTLNATTEQAAEDARHEAEGDQNKTLLSHSYVGPGAGGAPEPAPSEDPGHDFLGGPAPVPGSASVNAAAPLETGGLVHSAYAVDDTPPAPQPAAEPLPQPTPTGPADLGLPMPPAVPDFSQLPPTPAEPAPMPFTPPQPATQPELLGDILAPEPGAPTSSVPPVTPPSTTPPAPAAGPNDPGQFQIPGQ